MTSLLALPAVPQLDGERRQVKLLGEEVDDDLPKGAIAARRARHEQQQEEAMPRGVYDRTKRNETAAANDAPTTKKPRKPRKARAGAMVPSSSPPPAQLTGRFDVSLDLRGGAVTIHATNGALTLAPDEVAALFTFMRGR